MPGRSEPSEPTRYAGTVGGVTRGLSICLFGLVPALLLAAFTLGTIHRHPAVDFHAFWQASRAVLDHRNPYTTAAHLRTLPPMHIDEYVYPPALAILITPLGLASFATGAVIFTILTILAIAASLYLLEVRDWRCYGVAFASQPVLDSVAFGAIGPVMLLLVAAAWRWREQTVRAGICIGAAGALKLFLLPTILWLVVTRRFRAATIAAVTASVMIVGGWLMIGFAGMREYPGLLSTLTQMETSHSYSTKALASGLGIPWVVLLAAMAGAAAICIRRADDGALLAGAIGLSLLVTPVVWLHYLVLLIVPVALRSPRLGWWWLALLVMWVSPYPMAMSLRGVVAAVCVVLAVSIPPGCVRLPALSPSGVLRRAKRLAALPVRPAMHRSSLDCHGVEDDQHHVAPVFVVQHPITEPREAGQDINTQGDQLDVHVIVAGRQTGGDRASSRSRRGDSNI
jgi:Glycosyltransferase family 87